MLFIVYYVSSMDIIHALGLSCNGMRVDCVPGRINIVFELIKVNGKMKGLCYELCGQYHSSMVILGFSISLVLCLYFHYIFHWFSIRWSSYG